MKERNLQSKIAEIGNCINIYFQVVCIFDGVEEPLSVQKPISAHLADETFDANDTESQANYELSAPSVFAGSDIFEGDMALLEIFNKPFHQLLNTEMYHPCTALNHSRPAVVLQLGKTWQLKGRVKLSTYNLEDLCKIERFPMILYNVGGYEKANQHCKSLGGHILTHLDITEEILKVSVGSNQTCRKNNEIVSWVYTNESSYERLTYHMCKGLVFSGEVRHIACVKLLMCSICIVHKLRLTMYGHDGRYFDNVFHLKLLNGESTWFGSQKSVIKQVDFDWVVQSPLHATYLILHNETLPIGRKTWLTNSVQHPDGRLLTLSRCKTFEFSCDDATCISMKHRCDDAFTCVDLSDERNCDVLKVSSSYNEFYEPPPRPGETLPSILFYDTVVYHMGTITTDDGKARMDLGITVSWFDPRLDFVNLKKDKKNYFQCERVWKPSIRVVTGEGDGSVVATKFYEEQCFTVPRKQEPYRTFIDPFMSELSDSTLYSV